MMKYKANYTNLLLINWAISLSFLLLFSCAKSSQTNISSPPKETKKIPKSYKVALVDFEIGEEKYYTYQAVRDFYEAHKDSIEASHTHESNGGFFSDAELDSMFAIDDSIANYYNGYLVDSSDHFTNFDTTGVNFPTSYSFERPDNQHSPFGKHICYPYAVDPNRNYTARISRLTYDRLMSDILWDSTLLIIDAKVRDTVNVRHIVMELHRTQKIFKETDSHDYALPVTRPPISAAKYREWEQNIENRLKKLEKELTNALFQP